MLLKLYPRITLAIAILPVCFGSAMAADGPAEVFARSWEGQNVIVRYPLYSLVYNERGRLGNTRESQREGLTVAAPFDGLYYQFDGRQGRDDVRENDPHRIVRSVNTAYQGDQLEVRAYRRIEALLLSRYEKGVELIVKSVRLDRDSVRLGFAQIGSDRTNDTVTSLTIKWPAPLSKTLSERTQIENLILRFVAIAPTH